MKILQESEDKSIFYKEHLFARHKQFFIQGLLLSFSFI